MGFSALCRDSSIGLRVRDTREGQVLPTTRAVVETACSCSNTATVVRAESKIAKQFRQRFEGAARGRSRLRPLAKAERRLGNGSECHVAQAMIPHPGNEAEDLSAME